MTLISERGFGLGIAIAIIAAITLLGGGAYVATHKDIDVDIDDTASTTDNVNGTVKIEIKDQPTIELGADASTTIDVNSGTMLDINADVGGSASANY